MQTPRSFLDFVVDGESLYERRLHALDLISCLGWFVPDEDEKAARRLLLREPADVDGRVSIYVCPECGDPYCGVATATIEVRGEDVLWRTVAASTFDYEEDRWNQEPVA